MDKRLEKRHKRQVARAKAKVKISEPDVRTPEQIAEARAASQASASNMRGGGSGGGNLPSAPSTQRMGRSTSLAGSSKSDG